MCLALAGCDAEPDPLSKPVSKAGAPSAEQPPGDASPGPSIVDAPKVEPAVPEGWTAGEWSNTEAGLRARLLVGPGRIVGGTPVARIDLELENVSDTGTPMLIRWDERALLQFALRHPDGSDVATGMRNGSVKRPQPYDLQLPYHATLRMDLSVSGWSIAPDHRVHLALPNKASWTVPTDETRPLELSLTLEASVDPERPRAWRGKLEVPALEVG